MRLNSIMRRPKDEEFTVPALSERLGFTRVDSFVSPESSASCSADANAATAPPPATLPSERNPWQDQEGQSFLDFVASFKRDAHDQLAVFALATDRIAATLSYFDKNPRVFAPSSTSTMPEQRRLSALFEAASPLPCSADRYTRRMIKYGMCSPCNVVVGLIYLHRIQRDFPFISLSSSNAQRLLLTAVMVASKMYDDIYYSNKVWGMIGDLSVAEMSAIEIRYVRASCLNTCGQAWYYSHFSGLVRSPMSKISFFPC
jgi:hypothetical protein